jgi:hypothetical protein
VTEWVLEWGFVGGGGGGELASMCDKGREGRDFIPHLSLAVKEEV